MDRGRGIAELPELGRVFDSDGRPDPGLPRSSGNPADPGRRSRRSCGLSKWRRFWLHSKRRISDRCHGECGTSSREPTYRRCRGRARHFLSRPRLGQTSVCYRARSSLSHGTGRDRRPGMDRSCLQNARTLLSFLQQPLRSVVLFRPVQGSVWCVAVHIFRPTNFAARLAVSSGTCRVYGRQVA